MDTQKRRIPPQLQMLPCVEAEPLFALGPGGKAPSLEGAAFDRDGNFYCCRTAPNDTRIVRIEPDGSACDFAHITQGMVIGLAFHADGRLFATDMMRGSIRQFSAGGELITETFLQDKQGKSLKPDCMAFDDDGSLFVTDLRGTVQQPTGGVWRLSPRDGYDYAECALPNLASPNGICLSKAPCTGPTWDSDAIYIGESASNSVLRVCLDENHEIVRKQYSPIEVFKNPGKPNIDSLAMDERGNVYAGVMFGGRAVVLDQDGLPLQNIIVPGFEDWKLQYTPNLAIHPTRPECYLLASDGERAVVLRSPALARSQRLYAYK